MLCRGEKQGLKTNLFEKTTTTQPADVPVIFNLSSTFQNKEQDSMQRRPARFIFQDFGSHSEIMENHFKLQ